MLAEALAGLGHQVQTAANGAEELTALAKPGQRIDLMVLDRSLPVIGGDMVARMCRDAADPVRILMLTALATSQDTIDGLNLGADEYMTKPFELPVFLARVAAMVRRACQTGPVLEHGDFSLDPARSLARYQGRQLRLRPRELAVLELLLEAGGGFCSTDLLYDAVWGAGSDTGVNVVKTVIHSLRRKTDPKAIVSGTGLGYRLAGREPQ
jgi:DNA-binding response OmpR family regulator